jgi:hypothetical protein
VRVLILPDPFHLCRTFHPPLRSLQCLVEDMNIVSYIFQCISSRSTSKQEHIPDPQSASPAAYSTCRSEISSSLFRAPIAPTFLFPGTLNAATAQCLARKLHLQWGPVSGCRISHPTIQPRANLDRSPLKAMRKRSSDGVARKHQYIERRRPEG